ncbi:MAG: methylenetetrahydrofolate reductase [Pseudomonadota bacterium]
MAEPIAATDGIPDNGTAAERRHIRALLRGFSIEVSSRDAAALDACPDHLDPGTDVYLNWIPGDTHHRTLDAAARLRRSGFTPVPHVAARYLASFTQLADFLARLSGEAGVTQALAIGGDRERPIGPVESGRPRLATGLFQKHRITRVGIAGYPEGSPRISESVLEAALAAKLDDARRAGLAPYVVTQFGFEAEPIAAWLRKIRGRGIDAPVRVGLAGPNSITTLMKYALRCGVGASVRALSLRGPSIARRLTEAGPERTIRDLARALADDPALGIAGLHFLPFGGFARTADWVRAAQRSDLALAVE